MFMQKINFRVRKYSYSINNKYRYGGRLKDLIIFRGLYYKLFLFVLIFAPIVDCLVTNKAINILGVNHFLYHEASILKYYIVDGKWYVYLIPAYICNFIIYNVYKSSLINTLNLYNYFCRCATFIYCCNYILLPFLSWEFLYFRMGY